MKTNHGNYPTSFVESRHAVVPIVVIVVVRSRCVVNQNVFFFKHTSCADIAAGFKLLQFVVIGSTHFRIINIKPVAEHGD